jgi:protein SPT2
LKYFVIFILNYNKEHDQSNIEPKIYDEYEDEDEYDSEMDDFIDDDDVDNNSIEKKNDYSKCIREIFKYNPNRYKADDEDDLDNMETDFHTLQKEEKRR